MKERIAARQKDVLKNGIAKQRVRQALGDDIRRDLDETRLVEAGNGRLEDDLGHADALDVEVELVGLARALRVEGPGPAQEGVHEALAPVGLGLEGAVFGEGRVVFEELGFEGLEGGGDVFFVVVVAARVARRDGPVHAPVVVVGAEVVVVVAAAPPLLARCVRGEVRERLHPHLAGERFAVA